MSMTDSEFREVVKAVEISIKEDLKQKKEMLKILLRIEKKLIQRLKIR